MSSLGGKESQGSSRGAEEAEAGEWSTSSISSSDIELDEW